MSTNSDAKDSSPRATGPAGGQFEAKVGTHYALALLARTEPFGLPGAVIDLIEFQRGGQGYPLDDVIVKGVTRLGQRRCLEIQVKRSMAFTENDDNFSSIVEGIVTARKTEASRRFAVAVERTSGAIENGVQEALELAQQTVDAASFLRLLETPGRSNSDMRRFVAAFRLLLAKNGEAGDMVLFDVLRSFSVLTFDYARPNSLTEHYDRWRATQLASARNGTDLYDALFGLVLRTDAIGGELSRNELTRRLEELNVVFGSAPQLALARVNVEEMSRYALSDIGLVVNGCRLSRDKQRRELESLLETAETKGGVVEITGPSGTGKSGLLRTVIDAREVMSRIIVLAPDRTTPGGWPALRAAFDIEATAEEFLSDLACDGGAYLCIDGFDRFRDSAQRKTVLDLLQAAFNCPGVTVLLTTQPGWEEEGAHWISEEALTRLSKRASMFLDGLDDDEAEALASAAPQLAALLRPDHPAKPLARNLLKLRLMINTRLNTTEAVSEAALARDWWLSGAQSSERATGETHARRRVLNSVAKGLIENAGLVDVSNQDPQAVAEMCSAGVLVDIRTDRVRFRHDLFTDWAVACVLSEDPGVLETLALDAPPPFWLARGFELACRMLAESDDEDAWTKLVARVEVEGVASSWASLALLAIVRSELADGLLKRYDQFLLNGDGLRAARLIRRCIASHTQSATPLLKTALPEIAALPEGLTIPSGPEWMRLIGWCLQRFDRLGPVVLSAAVDLFKSWLSLAALGEKIVSPILIERLADILVTNIRERDRPLPRHGEPLPEIKYAVTGDALETARLYLALGAPACPGAAKRYLKAVKDSKRPEETMSEILEFPGRLPSAAPAEFAAAFLRTLVVDDDEDGFTTPARRRSYAMSRIDGVFALGRCGIGVFKDVLEADSAIGLSFIQNLVENACGSTDDQRFSALLLGESRTIYALYSYGWSRGRAPSTNLSKALMALEYWAHRRIDQGETLDVVVKSIAREGPISGALWLLIVDLVLSHSSVNGGALRDLLSSPESLALDAGRANLDSVDRMSGGRLGNSLQAGPKDDHTVEQDLANRKSRLIALHDVVSQVVIRTSEEEVDALRAHLETGVERLGTWTEDTVDWASPRFMAAHALRLASRNNYEHVTELDAEGTKQTGWVYKWPAGQQKWLEDRSAKSTAEQITFNRSLAVRMAMDNETNAVNVNVADAEVILDETTSAEPDGSEASHDPNDPWLARVSAAAFLARFGSSDEVIRRHEEISSIFTRTLRPHERPGFYPRDDIMFDVQAIAILGRLYLATVFGDEANVEQLLMAVAEFPASAAPAFLRHGKAAEKLDNKLLISLSRIALVACRIPRRAHYDEDDAAYEKRRADLSTLLASRIQGERYWLNGKEEPGWPTPPLRPPRRPRRKLTIGGKGDTVTPRPHAPARPDFYYDEKTGTSWLKIVSRASPDDAHTSKALVRANRTWLLDANKPGGDDEDERDIERDWTRGVVEYAAVHARQWSEDIRRELIFDVLKDFSDEAFIDAAATLIVQSDLQFIEGDEDDRSYLLTLRETVWPRLRETRHWRNHLWSSRDGMEIHLKELISAFYMRVSYGFGEGTSYTKGLSDRELIPFFPLLSNIAAEASSCPTIARLLLDVLEQIDASNAEPLIVDPAARWAADANERFWGELGVGTRVCAIALKAETLSSREVWAVIVEAILESGVSTGEELKRRIANAT